MSLILGNKSNDLDLGFNFSGKCTYVQMNFSMFFSELEQSKTEESIEVSDTEAVEVKDTGVTEETEQILTPLWEKPKLSEKIHNSNLHPEILQGERNQFRITDDQIGHGTQKEKFRANIQAIQLLKKCEDENRYAR